MNFSVVDADGHIKGLHYHLEAGRHLVLPAARRRPRSFSRHPQGLADLRPHAGRRGGRRRRAARSNPGRAWPTATGPLTNPCALLYIVTEPFDPASPDEYRIAWDHPAVKSLWEIPNG